MYNPIKLAEQIATLLSSKQNVFLVGPADSGKSWFATNELLPYLLKTQCRVKYFENCDAVSRLDTTDIDTVIIDEVESFQDREYLEKLHPNESPYYSTEYLTKVANWHKALAEISLPGVFIISREKQAIPHFIKHVHSLDWNDKPAEVIEFTRMPK